MNKRVSILLPSIRPKNLEKVCKSIADNAQGVRYEIVIVSPYALPEAIHKNPNVKYLRSYATPTICYQLAALISEGEFIYNLTDDGLLQNNCINLALETWEKEKLSDKDVINMIYKESTLDPETLEYIPNNTSHHPPEYWTAGFHRDQRGLAGVDPNWKLPLCFFLKRKYYMWLGGFDCQFENMAQAALDLSYRMAVNGARVVDLPKDAFFLSHLPHITGDHRPIHEAFHGEDHQKFYAIYSRSIGPRDRITIDFNNWMNHPPVWTRRFDPTNLPLNP
jgi:hypothetical protein